MYLSKVLTTTESRYWPTELEVAALIWVVRKNPTHDRLCPQTHNGDHSYRPHHFNDNSETGILNILQY